MRLFHIDLKSHTVSLTCRYPVDNRFIASRISDDEVYDVVLDGTSRQILVLYMKVKDANVASTSTDPVLRSTNISLVHI